MVQNRLNYESTIISCVDLRNVVVHEVDDTENDENNSTNIPGYFYDIPLNVRGK